MTQIQESAYDDVGPYVPWDTILRDVKVCRDCGTLVTDTRAHSEFHDEVSRAARRASRFGPIG